MNEASPGAEAFDDAPLESVESGPKPTPTLHAVRSPLAAAAGQLALLDSLDLGAAPFEGDFRRAVASAGELELRRDRLEVLQVNLGRLCNMTCRHCHVDAGPDRVEAMMDRSTVEDCLAATERLHARTLDVTGGAPELHPDFRWLIDGAARLGVHVIDRCNLTVLLLPRHRGLAEWLGDRGVELVCSLPHFRRPSTDAQRGEGTFDRSIAALRLLNAAGYGSGDPRRVLTLVTNPAGAFLPGNQAAMEREWKRALGERHGVRFDRLIALANMPISRYLAWLEEAGNLQDYMELLLASFNPATVAGVMCRSTLSVAYDGTLHDCDFNQMLDLPLGRADGRPLHIADCTLADLDRRPIVTARHCFGCTAGAGSSCGGALG